MHTTIKGPANGYLEPLFGKLCPLKWNGMMVPSYGDTMMLRKEVNREKAISLLDQPDSDDEDAAFAT